MATVVTRVDGVGVIQMGVFVPDAVYGFIVACGDHQGQRIRLGHNWCNEGLIVRSHATKKTRIRSDTVIGCAEAASLSANIAFCK